MKIFKELKKLGYKHYTENTIEELDNLPLNSEERVMEQSLVLRWFREKYNLVIEPCVPFQRLYSTEDDHFEILEFGYRIYSFDQYRGGLRDKIEWDGYDNSNEEEAELECLKNLILLLKKNEK